METQGPRTTGQVMGLIDFGQHDLKMLQEKHRHAVRFQKTHWFFLFCSLFGSKESENHKA